MAKCKPLSDNELDRLIKKVNGKYARRDKAWIMLSVRTGFRISEILSLRINDIWQYGQVVSAVTVKRKSMKGKHSSRTVPLHSEVRPYIREWVRESFAYGQTLDSPLFWSQRNPDKALRRDSAYDIINGYGDKARIQGTVGTHSGRKTFAQRMHKKLKDPRKTKEALGHRSIDSTIAYIEFDKEEINQAILED